MHGRVSLAASPWVARFAPRVAAGGRVLDLACGGGRHSRLFAERGHPVLALDRDPACVERLAGTGVEFLAVDLETGGWPLAGQRFAAIVVTNYLHRPLLPSIAAALVPGGVLIYETFAIGNERFGKPSNPDFLLRPGELLAAFASLRVIAYEDGETAPPARVQRLAAVNWPAGEVLPTALCGLDRDPE
ncbi:MAG: class I SAM-dependent methyltransferase [Burkholderiaceae bacterium]